MAADTAPQPPPARGVNAPGEPWTTVRRRMGFPQSAGVALDRCQPSTAKPLVGSWPGSRRPPQRRVVGELVPAAFAVAPRARWRTKVGDGRPAAYDRVAFRPAAGRFAAPGGV